MKLFTYFKDFLPSNTQSCLQSSQSKIDECQHSWISTALPLNCSVKIKGVPEITKEKKIQQHTCRFPIKSHLMEMETIPGAGEAHTAVCTSPASNQVTAAFIAMTPTGVSSCEMGKAADMSIFAYSPRKRRLKKTQRSIQGILELKKKKR